MTDKIKEIVESLDFNEDEVSRLAKAITAEAYERAGIARLLNMCLKAKKIFKKLEAIEGEIKRKEEQRDFLTNEIEKVAGESREAMEHHHDQVKESNEKLREKLKADLLKTENSRVENAHRVKHSTEEANEKIAQTEKNIKSAQKREREANAKADLAEQRKKEIQEALA